MTTLSPEQLTEILVNTYCVEPWLAPSDLHTITVSLDSNATGFSEIELPCWLYCTNEESYFMYDKSETDALLNTVVVMASLSLVAAILLCFNTLYQHFWSESAATRRETQRQGSSMMSRRGSVRQVGQEKSQMEKLCGKWDDFRGSFKERPFTYDVPFCVTLGCILISLGQLMPHMAGKKHVACNLDENTYVQDVPGTKQPNCAFWGIVLLLGIHVTFSYQSMLSASLWRSLYQPMGNSIQIPRQYVHLLVWIWVSIWVIYVLAAEALGGDIVMGTCNTASSNADTLLVTLFIPSILYTVVSIFFSSAVIYKLYTHLRFADMNTNKALTAFMRRFSVYSILCTAGALAFCVSIASFHRVFDKTSDAVQEYVSCQVLKETDPTLECKRGDVPNSVFFWMLPVITFVLSLGALVLSFNEENIEKWKRTCCAGSQSVTRFRSQSQGSGNDSGNRNTPASPISAEKHTVEAGTLRPSAHKMTSASVDGDTAGTVKPGMVNVRSLSPPSALEAGASTPLSTDSGGGGEIQMVEARVTLGDEKAGEMQSTKEAVASSSELVTEEPQRRDTNEDILADAMAAEFMAQDEGEDEESDDDSEDALPLNNQISVPIVVSDSSGDSTGKSGVPAEYDAAEQGNDEDYGATVVVKADEGDDFVDGRDQRGQSEAL